jgi:hypothetical protein
MDLSDDAISRTVRLLHARDFSVGTQSLLREIIDQKKIAPLLIEMLNYEKLESENPETAVSKTMVILESLIHVDRLAACLLMSQLYMIADDLYMHHICNAIDMWIYEDRSPELKRQLGLNAPSGVDEDMKRHYDEWIRG